MERVCRQGTGRVVGKRVQIVGGPYDGECGTVTYYDRYEKAFLVKMDGDKHKNQYNPAGIIYADRDSIQVIKK